jgi:regulatory protein
LESIDREKLEKRARNILLFQLGRSMKTEHQLRLLLAKREIPTEVVEPLLTRFVEAQLIDDALYARSFVSSRLAAGGKSISMLRRELKLKGVSDELIQDALSDLDAEQEFEIALKLARSRAARTSSLEPEKRRRRLLGVLMRRGFSGAVASRAMSQVLSEE